MKKILPLIGLVVLLMLFMVPAASAAPPAWGGDCGDSGGSYHCVRYGETLFSIGRRYGVNPYYIARVNGLRNPNYIYAGQILYIPGERRSWDGYDGTGWSDRSYRRYPQYQGSYGYDYTGYYYDGNFPKYQRYSYTCGYYYNCY